MTDLDWLLKHVPQNKGAARAPELGDYHAKALFQAISLIESDRLPYTIGLFGTWGSGKTTILARLAKQLGAAREKGRVCDVLYFNAWKYASFMEITPALIYQILKAVAARKNKSDDPTFLTKITRVMTWLGTRYLPDLSEWVKSHTGLDPSRIIGDFKGAKKIMTEGPELVAADVIDQYYTQLDRAQDLLREVFEGIKEPLVVLVDELDRCDPDEAFRVVKQLRVFFAMRFVPLVLVVTANPEPIGLAIKHQYGLDAAGSDYEARRILEKFVDAYVEMSEEQGLGEYVEYVWKNKGHDPASVSFIVSLDKRVGADVSYNSDTVRHARALDAITSNNPLYSNLRVLSKSLDYVCAAGHSPRELWAVWHLQILRQMDIGTRRRVSQVSHYLKTAAIKSHISVLRDLREHGNVHDTGAIKESISLPKGSEKGRVPFSVYRSYFWDFLRASEEKCQKENRFDTREDSAALRQLLSNHYIMDFLINMSLTGTGEVIVKTRPELEREDTWPEQLADRRWARYGWLLANY